VTGVTPSGKVEPEAGLQVTFTGATPSDTVGAAKVTAWAGAATPVTVTSAGQAICGGGFVVGPGGGGCGLEPHAAPRTHAAAAAKRIVNLKRMHPFYHPRPIIISIEKRTSFY
jgi:hypothetical protein